MTELVKTGITERLQPWQALFGLLTYVIGAFDVSEPNVLILIGFLAATLGFVQVVNYKHKEAIKDVVAPWLLERLLKILEEYLPADPPIPIEPTPIEAVMDEISCLKAEIARLEGEEDG